MTEAKYNPALHRFALLTAAATFPLIFMGGLVTSHGAGMSVPDWPNTYGYNMFTFPPSKWVGGIFYEHTHRLMGAVVGMLAIALTIWAWKTEPRRWVRWLAIGVLGAVIFQGVLGGLRVVMVELDLAIVHACFAQAFFCLTALMAVVTSKWWLAQGGTGFQPVHPAPYGLKSRVTSTARVTRLSIAALVVIYLQLVVGALMRHDGAGLAIPDLPMAYGNVLPPTDSAALADVNAYRAWTLHLGPVSLRQIWLHFGHRLGAVAVTAIVGWLVIAVVRHHRTEPALLRPALCLVGLILSQITLGVLTVLWQKPADIASAHVAVGALTLVTTFVLAVRAHRLAAIATTARESEDVSEPSIDDYTTEPEREPVLAA